MYQHFKRKDSLSITVYQMIIFNLVTLSMESPFVKFQCDFNANCYGHLLVPHHKPSKKLNPISFSSSIFLSVQCFRHLTGFTHFYMPGERLEAAETNSELPGRARERICAGQQYVLVDEAVK